MVESKKLWVAFSPEQKQAYTTVGGTPHLDGSYTVFGQVIEGLDVISKIAKVKRDHLIKEYSNKYPEFGFEKNKGYGTKFHLNALKKNSPTPIHRMTFKPIKKK